MSGSKQLKKSKRCALRYCCSDYTVNYKTAYAQGVARLINISSNGCAFESATVPLSMQEKIFISLELEKKQNIIAVNVEEIQSTQLVVKNNHLD